jgi:hypothetical protein
MGTPDAESAAACDSQDGGTRDIALLGSALIFAGRGENGEMADLVAWTLTPPRLARWYGCCSVLDEHNLCGWRLGEGQSLKIWRTPIGLLQARREGVVIIDRTNAAAALYDAGGLFMAENDLDAVELRRLLRPPEPMILTPRLVSRKTHRSAA